jgi:hypothetical protein
MADTKNFGLSGVGTTVQFGKAGPKFLANSGHFEAVTPSGTLTNVKGANAVQLTDLVTLAQLQAVQTNASNAVSSVDGFSVQLGDVTSKGDGSWSPGAVVLDNTTPVSEAVDRLNEVLAKLVPASPPNFPNGALSLTNTTGNTPVLAAGGVPDNSTTSPYTPGNAVSRTTSNPNTNTFNDVGPGDSGKIDLLVNGAVVGTKTLTGTGDSGTYNGLVISDQKDYPVATPGFWKSIDVGVSGPTSPVGVNKIKLIDSVANATNEVYFVKDSLTAAPVLSLGTVAQNALGTVGYSSGVPHYNSGGALTVGLSVANLAGETYYGGSTPLTITGANSIIVQQSYTYANQGISTPIARNTTAAVAITPVTVSVNSSNKFAVGTIQASATNVNGSSAAANVSATNILVMIGSEGGKFYEMNVTVSGLGALPNSSNAVRVNTGSGDTPAAAASTFVPSAALATYEAAVVAGVLKADQTDYSTGYLPVGPNLTSQAASQYVTFSFNRSAVSKFSILVNGSYAGCWIKLPGVSDNSSISPSGAAANGWWNMYVPYDGSGVPGEAGDPTTGCALGSVMAGTGNGVTPFVATFGTQSSTNATGNQILVRFKLNANQSITSLSFTN